MQKTTTKTSKSYWKRLIQQLQTVFTKRFGYDIFISYSRNNGSECAERLENQLIGRGFSVFRDKNSLVPGDPFQIDLIKQAEQATLMVCLLSQEAAKSPWVAKEIGARLIDRTARKKKVNIVPVYYKMIEQKREDLDAGIVEILDLHGFPQESNATQTWDTELLAQQIEDQFIGWRWRRILRVLASIAVAGLIAVLIFLNIQNNKALQTQAEAFASQAFEQVEKDPTAALKLAAKAFETAPKNKKAQQGILSSHHYFGKYLLVGNHAAGITHLEFIPNQNWLLSAGLDGQIKIWDLYYSTSIFETTMAGPITGVVLRDNQLIGSDEKGNVSIWKIPDELPLISIKAHRQRINSLVLLKGQNQLITAGKDSLINYWGLKDLTFQNQMRFNHPVRKLAQINAHQIAVGLDTVVHLVQVPDTIVQSVSLSDFYVDPDAPRFLKQTAQWCRGLERDEQQCPTL
ncbi:MAG: TIR domain-containing protein, partial [Bacteroidota bacterium]